MLLILNKFATPTSCLFLFFVISSILVLFCLYCVVLISQALSYLTTNRPFYLIQNTKYSSFTLCSRGIDEQN